MTQKTAWFLDRRIQLAISVGSFEKLSGECEADDTLTRDSSERVLKQTPVENYRDRSEGQGYRTWNPGGGGEARRKAVPNIRNEQLQAEARRRVAIRSALYSHGLESEKGLAQQYAHGVAGHAEKYLGGKVHTNLSSISGAC